MREKREEVYSGEMNEYSLPGVLRVCRGFNGARSRKNGFVHTFMDIFLNQYFPLCLKMNFVHTTFVL